MVLSILSLTTCPVKVRAALSAAVPSVLCALIACLQRLPLRRRVTDAAPSSRAQHSCVPCQIDPAWASGRWHAATAAQTARAAATAAHHAARPRTFWATRLLSSAHLPLHENSGYRQLGAGQTEGFARDLL